MQREWRKMKDQGGIKSGFEWPLNYHERKQLPKADQEALSLHDRVTAALRAAYRHGEIEAIALEGDHIELAEIKAYAGELAASLLAKIPRKRGIYIVSKVRHAPKWRALRDHGLLPIISTWIDEAGEGETQDLTDLWHRCIAEATSAECLIVYAEPDDVLKGGLVEVGAALGSGVPVYVVGRQPRWTWCEHELVTECASVEDALCLWNPARERDPDWRRGY